MKNRTVTALAVSGLLACGFAVAKAQDRDSNDNKGAPPGEKKQDTGADTSTTTGKIKQGAKNIFTELKFEDLPMAVQNTVKQHSGTAKINDIDREDRTGRTIYEVEFSRDGDDFEIHVAENGSLVSEEAASLGGADTDRSANQDRTRVRAKMSPKFSDLPPAVQATVKKHGQESEIEDIDIEKENGKTVYEVEFRRDGPNREIEVADDGTLLKRDRAVGAPGANQQSTPGADQSTTPSTR